KNFCNDPTFWTLARDPKVRIVTYGSEDSEGYKSSQHSLSLLLTAHGATAAFVNRLTLSSRDYEPLDEESRGVSLANKAQSGLPVPHRQSIRNSKNKKLY
ncbi:hypothetical protein Taro_027140, partial [Colocasia esculenta]|nr:hypothetical protein [Colocasia esculenta]